MLDGSVKDWRQVGAFKMSCTAEGNKNWRNYNKLPLMNRLILHKCTHIYTREAFTVNESAKLIEQQQPLGGCGYFSTYLFFLNHIDTESRWWVFQRFVWMHLLCEYVALCFTNSVRIKRKSVFCCHVCALSSLHIQYVLWLVFWCQPEGHEFSLGFHQDQLTRGSVFSLNGSSVSAHTAQTLNKAGASHLIHRRHFLSFNFNEFFIREQLV